jgi:nitronate monooxygenase
MATMVVTLTTVPRVFSFDSLRVPIVQAPLAGGPSTPELAAAVTAAGGLGFVAAGYKTVDVLAAHLDALTAAIGDAPYGVNLFAPPGHGADEDEVAAYTARIAPTAAAAGVELGTPRWDDDRYAEKLDLVCARRVPIVSFTFGCPSAADVDRVHAAGGVAWVTVISPEDAAAAAAVGADGLAVQGFEAGGHRGSFDDGHPADLGLLTLLQLVADRVDLPMVAAGGIASGSGIAAVLSAGASAAAIGTAFMLCPEAGTAPVHRAAIAAAGPLTALTRAFSGRRARGISNQFLRAHSADAISAYPQIHHVTAPLRNNAKETNNRENLHLWAGQAYPLAVAEPAADVVARLHAETQAALRRVSRYT